MNNVHIECIIWVWAVIHKEAIGILRIIVWLQDLKYDVIKFEKMFFISEMSFILVIVYRNIIIRYMMTSLGYRLGLFIVLTIKYYIKYKVHGFNNGN